MGWVFARGYHKGGRCARVRQRSCGGTTATTATIVRKRGEGGKKKMKRSEWRRTLALIGRWNIFRERRNQILCGYFVIPFSLSLSFSPSRNAKRRKGGGESEGRKSEVGSFAGYYL